METVKKSVAKLIANFEIVSNYGIETVNGKHPLSGLRMLRYLAKEYQEIKPYAIPYHFDRANNEYKFEKGFRSYCNKYWRTRDKTKNTKDDELPW